MYHRDGERKAVQNTYRHLDSRLGRIARENKLVGFNKHKIRESIFIPVVIGKGGWRVLPQSKPLLYHIITNESLAEIHETK